MSGFENRKTNRKQVCLSLLGTWHGDDAASKWGPQSTIAQVLLSSCVMLSVFSLFVANLCVIIA
jgi:ubiquitin-protein ligase